MLIKPESVEMPQSEWEKLPTWKRMYLSNSCNYRSRASARYHKWLKNNRDKSRAAARRWKAKNIDRAKRNYKNWVENNRDKRRLTSAISRHKHRAKTRLFDCSSKIRILSRECFCHWCCCRLSETNRQIDHVIPIARGGEHKPDNLVAACSFCNNSKNNRLVEEWSWRAV